MSISTSIPNRHNEHSSPILLLNNDILSYIFFLNADMEQETDEEMDPALVTLRHSSQVCASWRELANRSPLLWAQVLNLNVLLQKGDEWMKEVLRRTGAAPLHIKSINYSQKWLLTGNNQIYSVHWLLDECWTRIQSLDLEFGYGFYPDDKLWGLWRLVFERPAPVLEVFRFSWTADIEGWMDENNFTLLSGCAPSLRILSVDGMPVDFEHLSAPNLRTLVLHSPVYALTALKALSKMPLLETLEMKSGCGFHSDNQNSQSLILPVISLPRLTTVKFHGTTNIRIAATFLVHIIPGNGCTLNFFGSVNDGFPDYISKDLYRRIISKYSRPRPELQTATTFEVVLLPKYCYFSLNLPSYCQFDFGIKSNTYVPIGTISTTLSAFAEMQLDAIIKLKLNLYLEDTHHVHLNPAIIQLLLSFASIEELVTNGKTLQILQEVQRGQTAPITPTLKTISIDYIHSPIELSRVAHFINARVKLAIPANTLTVKTRRSFAVDVDHLSSSIPGLTVQMVERLE